jgi:type IV pilus assembly protein PilM
MTSGLLSKMGFNRNNELIGVDIGSTSIKICVLKYGKDGFKLQKTAVKFYEENLLGDGNIVDEVLLGRELKQLVLENGIKTRDAACALSSYSVIAKRVSVPFLDEAALENTMSLEVETVIPFSLKDIYYSYYVVGEDKERENMVNVQIVAAKKEIVDAYMRVFDMAGLNLLFLDVDIFGVTNLIEQIYDPRDMSVVAVDIGAFITNIAIMNEDKIEFTREVLIGGSQLTSQIMKSTGLSWKESEDAKRSGSEEIAGLSESFVSSISAEINKTVNFYASTRPMERIGKIFLTGGSSLLKGLRETVESNTRIEVEFVDPFLFLDEDKQRFETFGDEGKVIAVALYLSSRVLDVTA